MCRYCGEQQHRMRVRRSFIERHITHKKQYKLYCPVCKRTSFVTIGGNLNEFASSQK